MRTGIISLLLLMSMCLYASNDYDRDQIQQRISPVGNVHVEESAPPAGVANTATPEPAKQTVAQKNPGQDTYEKYCVTCHKDGLLSAPKFQDKTDWQPRLAKQNIDSLTATAIKGLNAMPPKGTCQECSEADIKAAIEYMVPK